MKIKNIAIVLSLSLSTQVLAGSQCEVWNSFDHRGHRMTDGNLFPKSISKNIPVCANKSSVDSKWEKTLKDNIQLLNNYLSSLNTSVHYNYLGYVESWEIDDKCYQGIKVTGEYHLSDHVLGSATYSYSPGNMKLYLNANHSNSGENEKGSVIIHELLHTIGLLHTGSSAGSEIPNTDGWNDTKYAGRSMMCEVLDERNPDYPQRHLNFLDQRAIETLYPK